jgi:hypothetical protein
VDVHLERRLRLHTEPKHKNLYSWAIQEIDVEGKLIGHDQIPWPWTLQFTATSCVLADNIEIQRKEAALAPPKVAQRQHIHIRLRPVQPSDDERYSGETTFSMFGTDRPIKSFDLNVYPVVDPSKEEESCSAWGFTSDNVTTDDCVGFDVFVKPDTFARYGAKIAHGLVDEITLSVGSVAGFYSEWSPLISADHIKVLAQGSEQNISAPPNHRVEPLRLGHVGKVNLYINRRLEFRIGRSPEVDAAGAIPAEMKRPIDIHKHPSATIDPRMFQMMRSVKRAAWFIVSLLAVILIVVLLKQ